MTIDIYPELPIGKIVYLITGILIKEGVGVAHILALSQHGNIFFSGTVLHHLNVSFSTRNKSHVQSVAEVFRHHLNLVLLELSLKYIKVLCMEYNDCVLLGYNQHFTFLHLLTKCHSFAQFKTVTLHPLAFCLKMTINLLIDFL